MNPWTVWRIRRNRARKWVRECRCGVAYWCDPSGRWDHRRQHGHEAVDKDERERRVAAQVARDVEAKGWVRG